MQRTTAYKVFTHDLRSPIQGGEPVWDGSLPFALPKVPVDTGEEECAAGWNATAQPETGLDIAGFWPDGWPARLYRVSTTRRVIARGDKLRAATWTIEEEITPDAAIHSLSASWFGDTASEMAMEQLAWHRALGRPQRSSAAVEAGLRTALAARGLQWRLKEYPDAWDAQDAWAPRAAWAAWDARDAWDARAARDAQAAWAPRAAWDARAARAAWAAWDARAALMVYYVRRAGWDTGSPNVLTAGLRDAYAHGLAIALPIEPATLGYALVPERAHDQGPSIAPIDGAA